MCSWLLEDENVYNPDLIDFSKDKEAASYWLRSFRDIMKKFSVQAANSQRAHDSTADKRAEQCYESYLSIIDEYEEELLTNKCHREKLSTRNLLDLLQAELRRYGFYDPWLKQKQTENAAAMSQLTARLQQIDAILNMDERWTELVRGVIAGNLFDSGAKAVDLLLEAQPDFSLQSALKSIQARPWLIDNLDEFLLKLREGQPHKCAVIFVDNSGVDIVLGILPFTRELLRLGTKVLLCANSEPALNDVTAKELKEILKTCPCEELTSAYEKQRLMIYANGQQGPCLDLRQLPKELCDALSLLHVDLVVIEGMGRALHTNLNAKFKCDSLKLVVIKNKWLAERLGGHIFSAICKYEQTRDS